MNIPKIVVWLSSEEERRRVKEGLERIMDILSNQKYVVANDESEAAAAIVFNSSQLLVTDTREEDASFALSMKEKNPALKTVRFGLSHISGPPQHPYDMLVTKAHPERDYETCLREVMKEFKERLKEP